MLLVHSKRNLLQREEVLDHLNECLLAVAPDGALLFTNAPAKSIIGEGHLPAAFPLWPEVQNAFAEGASYSDLLTKWAKPLKQVGLFIGEDAHGLTITVDDTSHDRAADRRRHRPFQGDGAAVSELFDRHE